MSTRTLSPDHPRSSAQSRQLLNQGEGREDRDHRTEADQARDAESRQHVRAGIDRLPESGKALVVQSGPTGCQAMTKAAITPAAIKNRGISTLPQVPP
jgi:hypothetical protein